MLTVNPTHNIQFVSRMCFTVCNYVVMTCLLCTSSNCYRWLLMQLNTVVKMLFVVCCDYIKTFMQTSLTTINNNTIKLQVQHSIMKIQESCSRRQFIVKQGCYSKQLHSTSFENIMTDDLRRSWSNDQQVTEHVSSFCPVKKQGQSCEINGRNRCIEKKNC